MNINLINKHLKAQGKEWKTVARQFAEATKDNANPVERLTFLRARVRFLEAEDKRIADEIFAQEKSA